MADFCRGLQCAHCNPPAPEPIELDDHAKEFLGFAREDLVVSDGDHFVVQRGGAS